MDDLLLAAPSFPELHLLKSCVVDAFLNAGFVISEQKIQRGPELVYLGYLFGLATVHLVGLDIKPNVSTLWDVQKLVGAI